MVASRFETQSMIIIIIISVPGNLQEGLLLLLLLLSIYIYGSRTFIQMRVLLGCRPPPRRGKVVGGRRSSAVVGRRRVALGLAERLLRGLGPPGWEEDAGEAVWKSAPAGPLRFKGTQAEARF